MEGYWDVYSVESLDLMFKEGNLSTVTHMTGGCVQQRAPHRL